MSFDRDRFDTDQREAEDFGGGLTLAKYWKSLKEGDFSVTAEKIADPFHWEQMMPILNLTGNIEITFMGKFTDLPARMNRAKAVGGLLAVRYLREKSVIATAKRLSAAFGGVPRLDAPYDESPLRAVTESRLNHGKGALSNYLLECVEDGDWKSLETMAKLLKRRDEPEDARGGELSYEGQTWTAFCLLHLNHRTLPTKRKLREYMALTEDNQGDFSKWVNRLGLGGLPAE